MSEVVFTRGDVWFPRVVRDGDGLRLELAAGADALHDPREFSLPIGAEHLEVLRDDLVRHLLLWSALLPLGYDAGTRGALDEAAAVALLDPVLLGTPDEVDRLFRTARADLAMLVRHGADLDLLDRGEVVAALRGATEASDPQRGQDYLAERNRSRHD